MAISTVSERVIRAAVRKAQAVRPLILRLDPGFYVVASKSRPGDGYLLRVYEDGATVCECEGNHKAGYCYHRAALALQLGTMPAKFTDRQKAADHSDAPHHRRVPAGKRQLWA